MTRIHRAVLLLSGVCVLCGVSNLAQGDAWDPPAGYYTGATGTGGVLKSQLLTIMSTGQILRTYGDYRFSSVVHDTDPNVPGNILLVYNRASVSGTWDSGSTWNREHVWPQSLQPGSASNFTANALSDTHSLRPANPGINSSRSNKPFGLSTTTGVFGSLGTFYFPGDADKGDIARILFYHETRWGPSNGITLVNGVPGASQMGDLTSLIVWHYLDPPDTYERTRNHKIFSQALNPSFYTNNRNAFIDNPEYVWSIWVDQNNDSQVSAAFAPTTDGSSAATAVLPPVLVNSTVPPETTFPVFNYGFDGTYFSVTSSGEATSVDEGKFNAFKINVSANDVALISLGIATATPGVVGLKTGQVVLDNLDITSGAGLGSGAQDGNDVISVEMSVLDHADASFASGVNMDSISHDIGAIGLGSPDFPSTVDVFNLVSTVGFTAPVDVTLASSAGDTSTLVLDSTSLAAIAAGGSSSLNVHLVGTSAGSFSATYTFDTSDDQTLHGATAGAQIVLTLTGVVGATCQGDLNGDNNVDGADLGLLLGNWASTGSSDINNDGITDGADLGLLLGAWGPCP
jgi:endonuclease I